MLARLSVYPPFRPARQCVLESGREYLIGRGSDCDLAFDDDRISRVHARLAWAEPGWFLTDLGSKNGTSVNGLPAAGDTLLADPSWLSFGGLPARFDQVSEAVRRGEERERLERWQSTAAFERQLTPGLGAEGLTEKLLASVLQLSGADRGFVLLARSDGDLEIAATAGLAAPDLGAPRFSGSVGAVERVLGGGGPVVVSDARADEELGGRASVASAGIRGLACLPLKVQDRVLGVLYVDSSRPGAAFTELDVEILEALTSHAALALSVARVDRELKRLAEVIAGESEIPGDPRRRLEREVETLWQRAVAPPEETDRGRTTWHAVVSAHAGRPGGGS